MRAALKMLSRFDTAHKCDRRTNTQKESIQSYLEHNLSSAANKYRVLSNIVHEVGYTWHSPPHSRVEMFCDLNSSSQFFCPTLLP